MGVRERLIEHCNAKDFQERLEQEVMKPLPEKPGVDRLNEAKLRAQALYHEYQKENEKLCLGTHVKHRCVVTVFNETLDRLYAIEPRALPKPRRQKYIAPDPLHSPELTPAEERYGTLIAKLEDEIHGTSNR